MMMWNLEEKKVNERVKLKDDKDLFTYRSFYKLASFCEV